MPKSRRWRVSPPDSRRPIPTTWAKLRYVSFTRELFPGFTNLGGRISWGQQSDFLQNVSLLYKPTVFRYVLPLGCLWWEINLQGSKVKLNICILKVALLCHKQWGQFTMSRFRLYNENVYKWHSIHRPTYLQCNYFQFCKSFLSNLGPTWALHHV